MPLIVIIGPDDDQGESSAALLREAGYDVTTAVDANDLRAAAARLQPAAIITRLGDAGAEGLLVCRALRSDQETRDTPIIVLTRRDDLHTREQILRAGATAISVEPLRRGLLLRQVRRVLARSMPRRHAPALAGAR